MIILQSGGETTNHNHYSPIEGKSLIETLWFNQGGENTNRIIIHQSGTGNS